MNFISCSNHVYLRVAVTALISIVFSGAPLLASIAATEIPNTSMKIPAMVAEQSVSTMIPSAVAPGQGLAVNIIYPSKPRYKSGAPVLVVVPGGNAADGLDFSMHAAQSGFAEVRFAFPGGGRAGFASGGSYDRRGIKCQQALRDVLFFAAGKLNDTKGRSIGELVPVPLYNPGVGLVGWSNGGNTAAVTLAKNADQLPFVDWIAFYETPLGSLFFPANLGGGTDLMLNTHYRDGSCATGKCLVDYRKLCWQPDAQKTPGAHRRDGEPEIKGVLFFDENGNKQWDEFTEFALTYATNPGLNKQIYPPDVTRALERLQVFADGWQPKVATLAESEAYFKERDGSLYIPVICQKLPHCLVSIFASKVDHLQHQSDHPHIALQYNSWLANHAHWLRLNPDPIYVGQAASMNWRHFAANKPNSSIDASDIDQYLEPEGLIPDYVFMQAAIAEMADRKKANKLNDDLTDPIATYTNGAEPEPVKPAGKTDPATSAPGKKTEKSANKSSLTGSGKPGLQQALNLSAWAGYPGLPMVAV